jgi:hypothetical protein
VNSTTAAVTNVLANLRSLRYRPGVMNAHTWYSQTGLVSTNPAAMPTSSRILKPSNGSVCSSAHGLLAKLTRWVVGNRQYGSFINWPSDWIGPTR